MFVRPRKPAPGGNGASQHFKGVLVPAPNCGRLRYPLLCAAIVKAWADFAPSGEKVQLERRALYSYVLSGLAIPGTIREDTPMETTARYIVVLEKDAVFQQLTEGAAHMDMGCARRGTLRSGGCVLRGGEIAHFEFCRIFWALLATVPQCPRDDKHHKWRCRV